MTAQLPERLLHRGETLAMTVTPLDDYFFLSGDRPRFQSNSTALWRGYIGHWELRDGRLYLIGLEGWLADGQKASLKDVFPGFGERVFAHWFHGTLRVPRGRCLQYAHRGFESVYEEDLLIDIEAGVLKSEQVWVNDPAGQALDPDAPHGYQVRAMTTWPVETEREEHS